MANPEAIWLPYRTPNPRARVRLFCLPQAGAGASLYRDWAPRLPPAVELCALQLPGHETRLSEPPARRMEELLDGLERAIRPLCGEPFALFGHCLGALIAYELARRLPPAYLFVSGRAAPELEDHPTPIHALPDADFLGAVRSLNAVPHVADPGLWALMLPALRADFELAETYRPSAGAPPLRCPITAFAGARDPALPAGQVQAWRAHTAGLFRLRPVDGDHAFLFTATQAVQQGLAADLSLLLQVLPPRRPSAGAR